jgi:hypothetical protein
MAQYRQRILDGELQVLAVDPALALAGARPRLLDEWQVAPALWNLVRRAVDASGQPGQFLLTGAGRFAFLRQRPMTLFEAGHSTGAVSLRIRTTRLLGRDLREGLCLPACRSDCGAAGGAPADDSALRQPGGEVCRCLEIQEGIRQGFQFRKR